MTSPWPVALLIALGRGQLLVAEVPASTPGLRAWVAVYPLTAGYNLFHRELDRAHLDNDWCIGPGDGMTEIRTARAGDEAELTRRLADWNVSPENLIYAHRSDYPV